MNSKHVFVIVNGLLLIPFIGSLLSEEFQWSIGDYIIAGLMLNTLGILLFISKIYVPNNYVRYCFVAITILLFLLLWAELAVGIFM